MLKSVNANYTFIISDMKKKYYILIHTNYYREANQEIDHTGSGNIKVGNW